MKVERYKPLYFCSIAQVLHGTGRKRNGHQPFVKCGSESPFLMPPERPRKLPDTITISGTWDRTRKNLPLSSVVLAMFELALATVLPCSASSKRLLHHSSSFFIQERSPPVNPPLAQNLTAPFLISRKVLDKKSCFFGKI